MLKGTIRRMRRGLPTASVVISCLALFFAIGGPSWAAKKLKLKPNSVATVHLKDRAVTTSKLDPGATVAKAGQANNALNLGGSPAGAYQKRCAQGSVHAYAYVDTANAGANYSTTGVTSFSCTGGAVQVKRENSGDYTLKFVNSPVAFAVASCGVGNGGCASARLSYLGPGEFDVRIHTSGGVLNDGEKFYIVAV